MIKKLQALKAKKGFTLVELIVVIAIIGVLAAILVPTLMGQVTKSKQSSLDSTAKSVVTTVNSWVADRYTHGKSPVVSAATSTEIVKDGAVVTGSDADGSWGMAGAASDVTSLNYAIADAVTFNKGDYVTIWWDANGKCVAAAFKQGGSVSATYSSSGWSGCAVTNEKDGIVTETTGGAMLGTNPKCGTKADDKTPAAGGADT